MEQSAAAWDGLRNLTRRDMLAGMGKLTVGGMLLSVPEFLAGCGGSAAPSAGTASSVKVAAVVSLTGPFAVYGQGARDGAKIAFDRINSSGGIKGLGGAKIDYTVYDSQSTPATAVTLTQRAFDEGATVVLGCGDAGSALAASQAAAQLGKPFVTGDPGDTMTTRGLKSVFQPGPVAGDYASQMVNGTLEIASAKGVQIKKATVMRIEISTFNSVEPILVARLRSKGIAVTSVSYPNSQTVFAAIANAANGADAVYQLALPADAAATIQAMKRADINPPLMCGLIAAYTDPKFYAQLGGDAQGLMGEVQFSSDLPYPWLKQEVDNWATVFGAQRPIDSFAAVYMACAATVVDALDRAKSSATDKVMTALKATKLSNSQRFVTVPGGVQFDSNGKNVAGAGVMVQYQDGKLTPIYPKPAPGKPVYPKPHWS